MSKITLPDLTGGYADATLINEAFAAIEAFSDNTVTRDGAAPNDMEADLDLNSNKIINLAPGENPNDAVTVSQLDSAASGLVRQTIETQTITAGFSGTVTFNTLRYTPGANNLAVYQEGLRLRIGGPPGKGYTEDTPSTIVLPTSQTYPFTLVAVTNEYLGTTTVPAVTVNWAQLAGVPAFASRWPTWSEVSDKPALASASHTHWAEEIQLNPTGESLSDGVRGVHVQSSAPTASRAGELWFW